MKQVAYLCLFLVTLSSCQKKAANATQGESTSGSATLVPATQEGVLFYANDVDKAFAMAKDQNKPVFVEIYSETCHTCQSFIPIFKDKQVSDFYNQNFFNYRIEVNSPEFQSFLLSQKIFVPSLPLLLFFNNDRTLQHLGVIEADAKKLTELGKTALNPELRGANMKKRLESGEQTSQFLVDLAMFSRVTMDTVTNRKAMELYAAQQPAGSYTSETNFQAIQQLVMDVDNPLGTYFITNLPTYRKLYEADKVKSIAENLVMSSLYSSFGNQYSSDKIIQIRDYLVKAEIDPQVARNRVLLPLINAYFKEKNPSKAVALVNTHSTQVPLQVADYLYLVRYFNEHSPDVSYVSSAQNWVTNALNIVQKNSMEEAELYYELASGYLRANNKAEAARYAQQALSIAQKAGGDMAKYQNLVGRI